MSVSTTSLETRLQRQIDERETTTRLHDSLLAAVEARDGKEMTQSETDQIAVYRDTQVRLDEAIAADSADLEASRKAAETAKSLRRAIAGGDNGVEMDGNEIVYRNFSSFALDHIITRSGPECAKIAQLVGGEDAVLRAKERLGIIKRTPANTLSGNVEGLQPPQFLDQIFQVIDKSRPLVAAAPSTGLVRGKLNYPSVTQRPVVAVQATEKTEGGNQGMIVDMVETTASTYLGGGDLSWQAINWSTPDALQLWFDLCAADYALKTESDAAGVVIDDAFVNVISSPLSGTPTYAEMMTAIGAGYTKVWTESGHIANTVVISPDRYGYVIGMTSTAQSIFVSVNGQNIGPLNILTSRGMDSGTMLVGDMNGLLVAETPGAPVELRVVEPAIGGLEVGLIGAFEAVIVDPGSFSLITTAS